MLNDYHYLYVEDDAFSREIMETAMQDVLQITNFVMFENSQDFMARVKALPTPPNVIFLDIHIEPHSGVELLQMLRQDDAYQNVTVIAVTASVMNDEIETLKQSNFNGAIGKPIDVMKFPQLLAQIVAGEWVWEVT